MSYHQRTSEVAKGKWRGILLELGLPEACLKDRHGPCPICGGDDRFRWDNKDGRGTYICTHCGAGDGMKLAIEFMGEDFHVVASRIDIICGNLKTDAAPARREMSEDDRRKALRSVYAASAQMSPDDLASKYLASRGIDDTVYSKALRFASAINDGDGGVRPCMIAMVSDAEGKPVSLHRTFLRPDGLAKAEMQSPRKLMPGSLSEGCAVRLSDGTSSALGIAEGIETALSASRLYGLPVWAAINTTMLAKWTPPDWCSEVAIFGDHDANFAGHAAAYTLAHRLAIKKLHVSVHIPTDAGTDWCDVYSRKKSA